MTPVSLFSSPSESGTPTGGAASKPSFKPGQIDTFRFNDSFFDWAKLGEFTVVTDGREPMRLHEPFDNRIINLNHIKPLGTVTLTLGAEQPSASPQLGLAAGTYFYGVTAVNRSLHEEIETTSIRVGSITIAQASPVDARAVTIDLSAVTRIWSEATHLAVYRSKAVAVGDADPFPTYARIALVAVADIATPISDTNPDDDLDFANEALNPFVGPPPLAPYITELKNRLFATGFEPINGVGAILINGNATVEIPTGTLDELHIGSQLTFDTGERAYIIKDFVFASDRGISPAVNDLITLGDLRDNDVNYEGTTGTKDFTVCFDPTEVRFSEPDKPWDWPPANNFRVGRGHGRNTMIGASRNTLIVGKRTETWAFGFNTFPSRGVDFQINGAIGSVSQRTFATDENGMARWLAANGIAEFNGSQVRIVSEAIADKFREVVFDSNRADLALRATAAHDILTHQYLCAIPTDLADKGIGAREIVVYHYLIGAWSIFQTQVEITAMTQDRDEAGYPVVLMGTRLGHVGAWGIGDTDFVGLPGNTGTIKGTVDIYQSSPEPRFLDSDADYFIEPTSPKFGVRGAAVDFFAGQGAGQVSRIVRQDVSPEFLYLEDKLTNKLDNTTQYRLGAIKADHRSPWIDFGTNKIKRLERIQIAYYLEELSPVGEWTLELFVDQPGVTTPNISQGGKDKDGARSNHSFTFKTTGSDERVASGRTSQPAIGLAYFDVGNVDFIRMQWRLRSDDPGTPGTIISVTPILRVEEEA